MRFKCVHGDGSAVKMHCDGQAEDGRGCPMPGECHIAAYCRRCDAQWEEHCVAHQKDAA